MTEYKEETKEKILESKETKCMTVSKRVPYLSEYKTRTVFLVHLLKNGDCFIIMHKMNTFCEKALCFGICHG